MFNAGDCEFLRRPRHRNANGKSCIVTTQVTLQEIGDCGEKSNWDGMFTHYDSEMFAVSIMSLQHAVGGSRHPDNCTSRPRRLPSSVLPSAIVFANWASLSLSCLEIHNRDQTMALLFLSGTLFMKPRKIPIFGRSLHKCQPTSWTLSTCPNAAARRMTALSQYRASSGYVLHLFCGLRFGLQLCTLSIWLNAGRTGFVGRLI